MEASPAVSLFLALGIIILASRLGGAIARRLGQPRVLGELIIGVLLGPSLLNLLHLSIFHGFEAELETTVTEFAEFGVLLLMFLIGLEVDMGELAKVRDVAMYAGVLGALLPVAMVYPVMILFGYGWQPAIFTGVTLAATSVSISAQVLLELGYLNTKEGNGLLATALVDDVLAILLVSIAVALVGASSGSGAEAAEGAGAGAIALIVLRMIGYIVVAGLVSWHLVPRIMHYVARQPAIRQSYGIPAFAIILALLFGWTAHALGGVAVITGSFIAGVGLSRTREGIHHEIEESVSNIAYGLLVPVFFVHVGLEIDLNPFPLAAVSITLILLLVAVMSKMMGCGLGGKLGGFTNGESFRLGVCMISRGEVGLIIASLGISAGVFHTGDPLFAALFMVILLSTLLTPVLVRQVFPRAKEIDDILNTRAIEG
jgi:Kef-type K+ transport system membrane component KefB